jgi:hypothetical protein
MLTELLAMVLFLLIVNGIVPAYFFHILYILKSMQPIIYAHYYLKTILLIPAL